MAAVVCVIFIHIHIHSPYWKVDQVFSSALSFFITIFAAGCIFWEANASGSKLEAHNNANIINENL